MVGQGGEDGTGATYLLQQVRSVEKMNPSTLEPAAEETERERGCSPPCHKHTLDIYRLCPCQTEMMMMMIKQHHAQQQLHSKALLNSTTEGEG